MGYTELQANANSGGFVVGIAGDVCNASTELPIIILNAISV